MSIREKRALCLSLLLCVPIVGCFGRAGKAPEARAKGGNGVLDIYDGTQLKARFIEVSTLRATSPSGTCDARTPCGFGRGVLDKNRNFVWDGIEHEQVFDIAAYGTSFVFYQNPLQAPPAGDWEFHDASHS